MKKTNKLEKNQNTFSPIIRFFSLLIIFFILGVCIFITGLINPSIPNGKTGILYSRIYGYKLIPKDKIFWSWQKFVPFALKIYTFDNTHESLNLQLKGFLAQTDTIIQELGLNPQDFAYSLDVTLEYRLKSDKLLQVLSTHQEYLQNGLKNFYEKTDITIKNYIQNCIQNTILTQPKLLWYHQFHLNLEFFNLESEFPKLQFISLSIKNQHLPDFIAYQNVLDIMKTRSQAKLAIEKSFWKKQIQLTIDQQQRLKVLESYGELLTKYPILITFFAVDQKHLLPREVLKDFFLPAPTTEQEFSQKDSEKNTKDILSNLIP